MIIWLFTADRSSLGKQTPGTNVPERGMNQTEGELGRGGWKMSSRKRDFTSTTPGRRRLATRGGAVKHFSGASPECGGIVCEWFEEPELCRTGSGKATLKRSSCGWPGGRLTESLDKWEAEKAGPSDANESAMRQSNPSSVRETSAIRVELPGWRIDQTETTGRGLGTRAARSSADEGKRRGSAAA
jgi:hypothetical protein